MLHNSAIRGLTVGCLRLTFLFTSLVRGKYTDLNQSVPVTSQLRPLTPQPVCGDSPNTTFRDNCSGLLHSLFIREGPGSKAERVM